MALPIPFSLPSSPVPIPFTGTGNAYANNAPIVTQLPRAQSSYMRKYSDQGFQRYLNSLPPAVRNSLIDFDLQRVQRGQYPTSFEETYKTTQSALTKQQATPEEQQGFFQAALGDIGAVVSGVPHLLNPATWINEATSLPEAPAELANVVSKGEISSLAEVPGVRLIPGAYTLSTAAQGFTEGGVGGAVSALAEHPVFTALDVLPYAKAPVGSAIEAGLSKLPRVAEARVAEAAALDPLNAARSALNLAPESPVSAARLALRTQPVLSRFRSSDFGNAIAKRVGRTAGDVTQGTLGFDTMLKQAVDPEFPIGQVDEMFRPLREPAAKIAEWRKALPTEDFEMIGRRLQDPNEGSRLVDAPDLTDVQRAVVRDYITLENRLADFEEANNLGLARREFQGRSEVITSKQARKLDKERGPLARAQLLADVRNQVAEPTVGVVPTVDTTTVLTEGMSRGQSLAVAKGYAHALDSAGYDARPAFDAINAAGDKTVPLSTVKSALDDAITAAVPRPQFDVEAALRPYARNQGTVGEVYGAVRRGDYKLAAKRWRETVGARGTHIIPESDQIFDALKRGRDRQRFLAQTEAYNPRSIARLEKRVATVENKIAPARFQTEIERRAVTELRSRHLNEPEVAQLIDDGLISTRRELGDEYADILREQAKDGVNGWKAIRDAGGDPVFVHRVGDLNTSVVTPKLKDVYSTPSHAKVRTGDMTPYSNDITVGLSHQNMEVLSNLGTREFINRFRDLYGVTPDVAKAQYVDQARRIAGNTDEAIAKVAERLARRDYTEYNPKNFLATNKAQFRTIPKGEEIWIPKKVAGVLEDMFRGGEPGLTAVFDPVMRAFRTAVLPLSPRWHINNIGGGFILGAAEGGFPFIKNLKRGWDYMGGYRNFMKGEVGEYGRIRGVPPSGDISQPVREMLDSFVKHSSLTDHVAAAHDYLGGKFMARLAQSFPKVRDAAGRFVDWSYRFNQMFDEMYRSTAYLTGHDAEVLKNAGVEAGSREAQQAGIALVRKILPQWDRMPPFERTIMRSVFPFYSWSKFILSYAYRYPVDHPFRTAVTASIARNEMEDRGDALPNRFMDAIFLGHPDAKTGLQSSLNLSGINPFRDVSNYFTWAGFTGNLNPIAQTFLEQMGVDTQQGGQDLYPDVEYDPETGRLRAKNGNFLTNFLSNTIPQFNAITAMLGRNNDFKQILRSNPEAARVFLTSSVGIPNLFRQVNPAQEAFKGELAREDIENTVKNEALKTGDYTRAMNFPDLRAQFAYLAQIQQTDPEALARFTPTTQGPSTADVAKRVYQGVVPVG